MEDKKIYKEYFTQFNNRLLEAIVKTKLNSTQIKIILVVVRFTMGFDRDYHKVSIGFINKATGINKQHIKDELKILIDKNVILVIEEATFSSPRVLQVNLDFDEWMVDWYPEYKKEQNNQPGSELPTTPGSELPTAPGSELPTTPGSELPTQEINNKDNKYKYKQKEVNDLFEKLWSHYPNKKGKNKICTKQKYILFDEGEEKLMKAINNYNQEVDGKDIKYIKYGSTFFNGGYLDYLTINIPNQKSTDNVDKVKTISIQRKNRFHNFEQKTDKYTHEELEDIAKRKRREHSEKMNSQRKCENLLA